MIPLIKLREDMRFTQEIQEMIDVLKGATASQFRTFQAQRKGAEVFKARLEEFLQTIGSEGVDHPFLNERHDLPKAVLVFTSDEGFLGGLNASVINTALGQIVKSDDVIVLGERGSRFLEEHEELSFTVLPGLGEDISYSRAVAIRDMLITKFLQHKIGKVLAVYPRFVSLTHQVADVLRILPCGNIFAQAKKEKKTVFSHEPLIEPDKRPVVDYMVKAWMMQKLYDIFWETKLSECAARIIHLEGSHEELQGVNKKLVYEYFKQLHTKSDKSIREIFASRTRWKS